MRSLMSYLVDLVFVCLPFRVRHLLIGVLSL
ncbi:hypothetical protein LINGRAHAP2_LOCUS400 [Linum grandiflorum]